MMPLTGGAPGDVAVPGRSRVGASWYTLFTAAWLVIWTVQLTPLQLLLPLQLDTSDSARGWVAGVVSSGLVLGVGGLAGVIAGPIAGALSDRRGTLPVRGTGSHAPETRAGGSRRRRPFALIGTWITTVCLLLTGISEGPVTIGIAWVGVSIGIAVASAAFTAMIADQLPVAQRGAASSASSSAQALGIVLGVGTVVLFGLGVFDSYLVLAGLMAVLGTAVSLLLPDPRIDAPAALEPRTATESRFAFLRDRDFRWVLIGRLVVNIGNALGTSLLLFFLLYGLGQDHAAAEGNLLLLIVVYTVFVVGASIIGGLASDRLGKRRSITVAAAVIQAMSGIIIVISPTFTTMLFAAALMGIGYGAFMAVGLAFATDLLPSTRDHARDLGVVNVIASLGQLLGPVIGAGLVALVGGFWLLFAMAALLSLVGAALTALARDYRAPRA